MPLGVGHMFARAPDPRVVEADHDPLELMVLDGGFQEGMKERVRFPGRTGEELVVPGPVLLGVALKTDRSSQGAFAHSAQNPKGHSDGPIKGASL